MPRPVLLAVDGDPAAKAALERELRKRYEADSQVLCAGSGAAGLQGLEQIGARGGEVARVLADLRLPDMSGMELMARVHGLEPAAKRGFHGLGAARGAISASWWFTSSNSCSPWSSPASSGPRPPPPTGWWSREPSWCWPPPRGLRRPVAFAATMPASAIALTAVTVPPAVAWFAPVLLIKLLLGHLLPGEAAPRGGT